MITAQQIIDRGVCPHLDGEICHKCRLDPSQLSYSMGDMADLCHDTQVAIFNWCGCEDGERQYGDCPTGATDDCRVERTTLNGTTFLGDPQ